MRQKAGHAMSIRLHSKHGLNPVLMNCFLCGEAKGIALPGAAMKELAPRGGLCFDKEPCDKCRKLMTQGVILISVKPGSDHDNPYRTGGWIVVRDEAIGRIFDPESAAGILKSRVAFLEDDAWDNIGFPRS